MKNSEPAKAQPRARLHPVLIMLVMLVAAMVLTHVLPSGKFERLDDRVVAGSYRAVPKESGLRALFSANLPKETDTVAKAAGPLAVLVAIPAGITKSAAMIFMIMFVGGLFGVLNATGAIDAGIDRLLHLTTGNVYLLTGLLITALASGATFLGLFSEYLAVVPLVLALGEKLRWPNLLSAAVVILPASVGYAASVTNPIVLAVAQPLAGVPVFSGALPRLVVFAVMLVACLAYVFAYLRRLPKAGYMPAEAKLGVRHMGVLILLALGTGVLVVGTAIWGWGIEAHSALFIAWAATLAAVASMRVSSAVEAFLAGMKTMMMPCVMIGLAGSLAIILQSSQVLDSLVQSFATMVSGHSRGVVAAGIIAAEMGLDVLINSTSAKAAISLPILTPIAEMSGIHGNVSVSALTLGGSLTNLIVPTSAVLLAFLAAAKVDYFEWVRFVAPLWALLCIIGFVTIILMAVASA